MYAMKDETTVHVIFSVVFQLKSKAHRGPIRIKKYFVAISGEAFKSLESRNEFPYKVFFPGESLDLIKFAICAIVYHDISLCCRLAD